MNRILIGYLGFIQDKFIDPVDISAYKEERKRLNKLCEAFIDELEKYKASVGAGGGQ